MQIPQRQAITLDGLSVDVPGGFTGARNAVLLMFEPSHFVVLNAWRSALKPVISECDPASGFYAVAVTGSAGPWRQKLAAWALRLDVQDPFLREHTALVFTDVAAWQREAGLTTLAEPVLAIAAPDGATLETAGGSPTHANVGRLGAALRSPTLHG